MSKVRVCFLGTPEFAVTCLKGMLEDQHYEIVGVITQPDRPAGRKMILTPTPVKNLALSRGLRVLSPESVNKEPIQEEIRQWKAEVAVVVAFGQILNQKFLDLFPYGCVNIHASVLPRWRGAAPIQRAIEYGDTETGVALQKMVKQLDAGDVIGVRKMKITDEMTAQELHDSLVMLGADLLHIELMDYVRGNLMPTPQDISNVPEWALYAKKIEKSESQLDWSKRAVQIHNKVRAFVMGPGTWTEFNGKKIKIYKTRLLQTFRQTLNPVSQQVSNSSNPSFAGKVIEVTKESLYIGTGEGILEILELQPESRSRQSIADFLKSNLVKKGDQFGTV